MKRRNFLKNTFLTLVGGVLLPSTVLSSCQKDTFFDDLEYDGKVLIIGAGVAGLYAAYLLHSKGIAYEIVEATALYGGRMGKRTDFADFPIDLGAQWLHGRNNIVADIAKKTNTKLTLDRSDIKYWFKNEIVSQLPSSIDIFSEKEMPDISFEEYAQQKGLGEEYRYIIEALAGDQGASANRLSVYWNDKEEENWKSGNNDYKFENTFFDMIDRQIAQVVLPNIRFNTAITHIRYAQNFIDLIDQHGNLYIADRLLITVPISILKSEKITFVPPLSNQKREAFSKIGMGAGMKVFLKFSSQFYEQNLLGGQICAAYVDEKVGKKGKDNVLLAFVMGKQAEYLSSLASEEAIIKAILSELDLIYEGKATPAFLDAHVQNWTKHPFIQGAYSYSTVGMGNAREVAAQSIDQKLFFAGEAMNLNGHHQTVHGAVESAYREVIAILNSVKK